MATGGGPNGGTRDVTYLTRSFYAKTSIETVALMAHLRNGEAF